MRYVAISIAICLGLTSGPALSWGSKGHHTVGEMADQLIKGTNAEKNVKRILKDGGLGKYAVWADCVKGPKYCPKNAEYNSTARWFDQEMKDFNKAFKEANPGINHHNFHYTDIPFPKTEYDPNSVGHEDFDVEHLLKQCVWVLRNPSKAAEDKDNNPYGLTERQALIFLAHLVGDVHQPLHVGAIYLDRYARVTDPNDAAKKAKATLGGNWLLYKPDTEASNLHHYWDTVAVDRAMTQKTTPGNRTSAKFAAALVKIPASATLTWKTEGPLDTWTDQWTNETLAYSSQVLQGFTFHLPTYVANADNDETHPIWNIKEAPQGWEVAARDGAVQQLVKAGHRLANLLKAIYPD